MLSTKLGRLTSSTLNGLDGFTLNGILGDVESQAGISVASGDVRRSFD